MLETSTNKTVVMVTTELSSRQQKILTATINCHSCKQHNLHNHNRSHQSHRTLHNILHHNEVGSPAPSHSLSLYLHHGHDHRGDQGNPTTCHYEVWPSLLLPQHH